MAVQPKSRAKKAPGTPKTPQPRTDGVPLFEWIAAAIGLTLALIIIGVTAWDALLGERSPAAIEGRRLAVRQTPHGFVAESEAINRGGAAATQVLVSGTAPGSEASDTAEMTFDYLPGQSSARGGLIFENDPRAGGLVLRAKSYVDVD